MPSLVMRASFNISTLTPSFLSVWHSLAMLSGYRVLAGSLTRFRVMKTPSATAPKGLNALRAAAAPLTCTVTVVTEGLSLAFKVVRYLSKR